MILGAFDERGRPLIRGKIAIPRLGARGYVTFLVDTGADSTCIHPRDASRMGIPFNRLFDSEISTGIGGGSVYFREAAIVSFAEEGMERLYAIDLLIAEPREGNYEFPSLLGRDVLNRWRIVYDPIDSALEILVRSADHTMH